VQCSNVEPVHLHVDNPVNLVDPSGREALLEYVDVNFESEEAAEESILIRKLAFKPCVQECQMECIDVFQQSPWLYPEFVALCRSACDLACPAVFPN